MMFFILKDGIRSLLTEKKDFSKQFLSLPTQSQGPQPIKKKDGFWFVQQPYWGSSDLKYTDVFGQLKSSVPLYSK